MKPLPPCVFPSLTEEEVITVPGHDAGTAYRLRVEAGMYGYLRIEQLGYNATIGWYTQKSFCLPGDVAHQLMPHLRQALALIPRSGQTTHSATPRLADDQGPLKFPGPSASDTTPAQDLRKEA